LNIFVQFTDKYDLNIDFLNKTCFLTGLNTI
jgi:hypothetical protein